MRKVTPAGSTRPGYPRLARAWRLLVAAPIALLPSLVHADATIPHDGDKGPGKGEKKRPEPPPPTVNYPILGGAVAAPDPPEPPKKKEKEKKPQPTGMILHPHDPGEPCTPIAPPTRRVV